MTLRLCCTVADLAAVQRLLVVLTGRRHAVTRFAAHEAPGGRWEVTVECPPGEDAHLLRARLLRPPAVLSVELG